MELYEELIDLTHRDRELLIEKTQIVAYRTGDFVLREGEARAAIFCLIEGILRIERDLKGESIVVEQLTDGEIFGEISFIEGGPASASVVAEIDCQIAVIDGQFVHALLESEAGLAVRFYRSIARILATRLRMTSGAIDPSHSWG